MATVKRTDPPLVVLATARAAAPVAMRTPPLPLNRLYETSVPVRPVPYAAAKRLLDITLALIGICILSPVFLLVGLAVKLTSRGPIIFRQTRVGRGGRYFTCYKFRSMCQDAERMRDQVLHLNEVSGPVFKIRNDPRFTPIGGFIRRCSLDELPQLWNVLRGDMSIVGPRPPVPGEVQHYDDRELLRLAVKPGLTCLWQVNGRSNIPFEHWMELDLLYVETMSFWRDVRIILQTVPAVLTCRGAH